MGPPSTTDRRLARGPWLLGAWAEVVGAWAKGGRGWPRLAEIGRGWPRLAEAGRGWPRLAEIGRDWGEPSGLVLGDWPRLPSQCVVSIHLASRLLHSGRPCGTPPRAPSRSGHASACPREGRDGEIWGDLGSLRGESASLGAGNTVLPRVFRAPREYEGLRVQLNTAGVRPKTAEYVSSRALAGRHEYVFSVFRRRPVVTRNEFSTP